MTIIVNGEPRKTSYIARVYPLIDNKEDAQGIHIIASDGNLVTVEIQDPGEEFKQWARSKAKDLPYYVDILAKMEDEQSDNQVVYVYYEAVQFSVVSGSGETIGVVALPGNMPVKQGE